MSFDRLPKGSTVLITGATGLVGSAISDLLLKNGFKVRGTGRSAAKAEQFKAHLGSLYGEGKFDFVEVANLAVSGAFDAALQGVSGVIHVATESSVEVLGGPNGQKILDEVADGTLSLMRSAAKTASVKSFVLTSSCVTVHVSGYGRPDHFYSLSEYNEEAMEHFRNIKPGEPDVWGTYRAAKVHSEKLAWKFWHETKPAYAFNSVLPFTVLGPLFNPTPGVYSTHSWLNQVFLGDLSGPAVNGFLNPTEGLVDTRDTAVVHVAALLSTDTNGERLWARGHGFTANEVLAIWRKAFPDRTILPDFDFPAHPKIELDSSKSTALIKAYEGRDWYPKEETLIANARHAI